MVRWLCPIPKVLGLISRKMENKQIQGGRGSACLDSGYQGDEAKVSLELRCLRLGGQYSKTREKRERETHTQLVR